MKKTWKILLIVFIVLLVLLAALAWWQHDNIAALRMAMTHDTQQIAEKMQEQDIALKKEIEQHFPDGIRDFTEEEKAQIESGEVTEKQVLAKIISEAAPSAEPTPEKKIPTTAEKQQEIISRYTSQLYAMEAEYIGKIEGLIASAGAEYKQKRIPGKNNRSLQLSIAAAYTGKLTALEGECDGRVEALLSKMDAELSAIGADKAILTTIRNAYKGEKTAKRAYYMSKYGVN